MCTTTCHSSVAFDFPVPALGLLVAKRRDNRKTVPRQTCRVLFDGGEQGSQAKLTSEVDPRFILRYRIMKPRALGVVGIRLSHTLTPTSNNSVHVLRSLQLTPRGPVRFSAPLIVRAFRIENERMMKSLKAFAEDELRGA
jgi:hypothetical protein